MKLTDEQIADAMRDALAKWNCPSCGGSKWYKHKHFNENGDFIEEVIPCSKCEQSGLHPIARQALKGTQP